MILFRCGMRFGLTPIPTCTLPAGVVGSTVTRWGAHCTYEKADFAFALEVRHVPQTGFDVWRCHRQQHHARTVRAHRRATAEHLLRRARCQIERRREMLLILSQNERRSEIKPSVIDGECAMRGQPTQAIPESAMRSGTGHRCPALGQSSCCECARWHGPIRRRQNAAPTEPQPRRTTGQSGGGTQELTSKERSYLLARVDVPELNALPRFKSQPTHQRTSNQEKLPEKSMRRRRKGKRPPRCR
jgi:hypothetical protein